MTQTTKYVRFGYNNKYSEKLSFFNKLFVRIISIFLTFLGTVRIEPVQYTVPVARNDPCSVSCIRVTCICFSSSNFFADSVLTLSLTHRENTLNPNPYTKLNDIHTRHTHMHNN